ncbi:MAG: hypothetical protein N2596_05210, partial [Syntrophorhabdaceae bacterium]|nr:hypothetical protein [Syntrophorhabdaceae bacterium]
MIIGLKKQKVYKKVFEDACHQFKKSNIEEQFQRSGIVYRKTEKGYVAEIPFFDEIITMSYPEFKFASNKSTVV